MHLLPKGAGASFDGGATYASWEGGVTLAAEHMRFERCIESAGKIPSKRQKPEID